MMKKDKTFIRRATFDDIETIKKYDAHISEAELKNIISLNRVYIAEYEGIFCGWLRYNLFWDNTPFMNMLYVLDGYRNQGIGKNLVAYWENEMKMLGYELVLTSTVSSEYAQHFYNKLGYVTIGGFLLEGDPYEIIMSKSVK